MLMHEPFAAADGILNFLVELNAATAGAVFRREGEGFSLYASRGIRHDVFGAVDRTWADPEHRRLLLAGKLVTSPDPLATKKFVIHPILANKAELVALLYLESTVPDFVGRLDLRSFRKYGPMLHDAFGGAGRPVTYLETTSLEAIRKDKLLILLARNEWNLARVARILGVTRRTVYVWLEKYDIDRLKPQKVGIRATKRRKA